MSEPADPIEELRRRLGIADAPQRTAGVVPQRMTLDTFQAHAEEHCRHLEWLAAEERRLKNEPLRELMRRLGRA
jgi:hypothetical protein